MTVAPKMKLTPWLRCFAATRSLTSGGNARASKPRLALDHRNATSVLGGRAGRLEPDHAAADDHDPGLMLNGFAKAQRILDVAQVLNFKVRVFQRSKPARPRSGRDQQAIEGERTAICRGNRAAVGVAISYGRTGFEPNVQDVAPIPGLLDIGHRRVRAVEHRLGQLRPLIGRVGFFAEDGDGALKAAGAQRFRRAAAGLARSCDHDVFDWRRQFPLSLPDAILIAASFFASRLSEVRKTVQFILRLHPY